MLWDSLYDNYSYGNFSYDGDYDYDYDWVSINIYIVLSIAGLLGNASIIFVILKNLQLRKSQINILIIHLAIGDLLFILLTVPVKIEHELSPYWEFGSVACKAYKFGETLAMGVCVYSITAFSVGRFLGIVMKKGERNFTSILVVTEWLVAIGIATPNLFLAILRPARSQLKYHCGFPFETTASKIYIVVWVSLLYIIPLVIIAYTNILVIIKLLQSTRKFSGEQVNRSLLKQFRIRHNRAAMFILITVSFAIFWLPYYVFRFWQTLSTESADNSPVLEVLRKMHYFAAIANSCCNPFVMYMMSSKYRNALLCRLSPDKKAGAISANSIRSVRAKTTRFSLSVKSKQTE